MENARKKRRFRPGALLRGLLLCALMVVVIFPLFWVAVCSFKESKDILGYPPRVFASSYTLGQYRTMLSRIPLLTYAKNSAIFAISSAVLTVFFDSMAGYALARFRFKGRDTIASIILCEMMLPFVILMIPLYILVYKLGILDTYAGLIIPRMTSAYGIYMMRSFFIGLPRNLEEAARIDGLGEFRIFAQIMTPLCKPAIITLLLFNMMGCWNDLLYPLLMTNSAEMRTISSGLAMFVGSRLNEYGPAMAATALSMVPLLLLYVFAQRYFVQGIAATGGKE